MELLNFIINFVSAMSLGEQLSIATGLIYIFLSVRQNPLCWPFGIISVGIWMVIVFQGKLYSDAFLQMVYVVLGFYGWYQWMRGGTDNSPLKVQRVDRKLGLRLTIIGIAAFLPTGYIMENYLEASFPWWDALTTILSLIAQYLLAKKYMENWLLWITADVMYIGIYYAKGWTGYSGLMAVYTAMAVLGFTSWLKSYREERGTGMLRVVLSGSECTGKSTLAAALAAHYEVDPVPEYLREYFKQKNGILTVDDVIPIAEGQLRLESETAAKGFNPLICDTDIVSSMVYAKHYFGKCPAQLNDKFKKLPSSIYLLCDIDIEWQADGQRDMPEQREYMQGLFIKELQDLNISFNTVSGNIECRIARAIRIINAALGKS